MAAAVNSTLESMNDNIHNKRFTEDDNCKKSLFQVREILLQGNLVKSNLGTACRVQLPPMFDRNTPDSKLCVLVTSKKVVSESESREHTQASQIVVDRFCSQPSSHRGRHRLTVRQIRDNDELSLILCDKDSSSEPEYFLEVGVTCLGASPSREEEVIAYTFWEDKVIEISFKEQGTTFVLAGIKNAPEHFELLKVVGAPVVQRSPNGQTFLVIGIVEKSSNGSISPLFFTDSNLTFGEENPRNQQPDETENPDGDIDLQGTSHAHDVVDTTDSPSGYSLTQPTQDLHSSNPRLQLQVQGNGHHPAATPMVTGHDIKPVLPTKVQVFDNKDSCIKKRKIGKVQSSGLQEKLKILLDPDMPLGNNFRLLAEEFGYSPDQIRFFNKQVSPTITLLNQEIDCTVNELREKLVKIKRKDAVNEVDEWVKAQECTCEECGNFL